MQKIGAGVVQRRQARQTAKAIKAAKVKGELEVEELPKY